MKVVQSKAMAKALLLLGLMTGYAIRGWAEENHVVKSGDLKQALQESAQNRKANVEKLQAFFRSDLAQKTLKTTRISSGQIEKAIPFLSDEELARLAAQARRAEADFSAGALTNQQITYIIIALATAVIILIIVAAH